MSAVPQNILDALTAVQADSDDLAAKQTASDTAAATLTQAQSDAAAAVAAAATSGTHLQADVAQLVSLIQATYGTVTPPAPTTPST